MQRQAGCADTARILIVLKMDVSAMMGVTSAVFRDFFGRAAGMLVTLLLLTSWVLITLWLPLRKFNRRNL